jgi:hypothetical protein
MTVDEIVKEHRVNLTKSKVRDLLELYRYQPSLTKKLDGMVNAEFSIETLLEIVLWKTSRYPTLTAELLRQINSFNAIDSLRGRSLVQAKQTLRSLLEVKGIQLPMASTILRFRNPRIFQIIDKRVYAIVCGDEPIYPNKPPNKITDGYLTKSIDMYFAYLEKLRRIARRLTLDFKTIDRVLYQLHKELGYTIDP